MGVFFDVSDNKFKFFDEYDPEVTGDINVGDASFSYANVVVDTLTGNVIGNLTGDVTGNTSGNAGTVGGLTASQFLRSDADDTATGVISFSANTDHSGWLNFNAAGQNIKITTDGQNRGTLDWYQNTTQLVTLDVTGSGQDLNFSIKNAGTEVQIGGNRILTTNDTEWLEDNANTIFQGGTYITKVHADASNTITFNHDATTRSDTTTGNTSPAFGGTFTAIDSITTNATGHVTAVNTKTITVPSEADTLQSVTTRGNTTNTNILFSDNKILGRNTADASDNGYIAVVGGGAESDGRGAIIRYYGNEHATNAGELSLASGNVTGGKISMRAGGTSDVVTVTSSGVGINDSSPLDKLSVAHNATAVYSSSAIPPGMRLTNHTTGDTVNQAVGIQFQATSLSGTTTGVAGISAVQYNKQSSADLVFQNRNAGTIFETMRIGYQGNVGIGDTSPSNKLVVDVNSASTGTDSISVRNSDVTTVGHTVGQRFQFNSAIPAAIRTTLTNVTTGAGRLGLFTSTDGTSGNLTERISMTSDGKVGISDNNPDQKVTIASAMSASPYYIRMSSVGTNTTGGGAGIVFEGSASAGSVTAYNAKIQGIRNASDDGSTDLEFYTSDASVGSGASTKQMVLTSVGRLGVGTASPNDKFVVRQGTDLNVAINTTTIDTVTTSRISSYNDAYNASKGLVINGHPLVFSANGAEAGRFISGGNFGVNNTNPHQAKVTINVPKRNDSETNLIAQLIAAGPISDSPSHDFTNSTAIFRVQGTDATNNLQFGVGGSGYAYNPWIQGSYDNSTIANPSAFDFKHILLQPIGGNVGIGLTTNPTEKLEVAGNISVGTGSQWLGRDSQNNSFGFNASTGQYINSTASIELAIDSNNGDNDTRFFRIIKNAYGFAGGTELFKVTEAGDATVSGDLTVTGDLTINGTTTTLNVTNLEVDDAVILLNAGQSTPTNDIGLVFQRYATTSAANTNVGIIWDEGNDSILFGSTQEDASDTDVTIDTSWLTISSNGNIGVGTTGPVRDLHINKTNASGQVRLQVENNDNTSATSHSVISIYSGGASGGDPFLHWKVDAVQDWSIGIDNGDADKLKISKNFGPGTNDYFIIDTNGNAQLNGDLTLSGTVPKLVLSDTNNSHGGGAQFHIDFATTGGIQSYIGVPSASDNNFYISTVKGGAGGRVADNTSGSDIYIEPRNTLEIWGRADSIDTDGLVHAYKAMKGANPLVHFEANYVSDTSYTGHGSVLDISSSRGDGFTDGYLLRVRNADGGTTEPPLFVRGDRKVGIGTNAPIGADLHILGGSAASGLSTTVKIGPGDSNTSNHTSRLELAETGNNTNMTYGFSFTADGNNTNNLLIRRHNNSISGDVAMCVVRDTGHVGIGTTDPTGAKLHVYDSTATSASATGTPLLTLDNYVGSDLSQQKTFIDFRLFDDNTNEYPQVRIGAEVGQNGDANTQEKEGSGAFVIYTNNADTTSGGAGASLAERMRVDYLGNVGINTASPTARLDVAGDVRVDSGYNLDGNKGTSTAAATVFTLFAHASFGAAKIIVTAKNGVNRQITELLITHDGTTAVATEYGQVATSGIIAEYEVAINGTDVELTATSSTSSGIVYNIVKTLID